MAKPKGKYAHITPTLKRLAGVSADANNDPKYQDRVNETKAIILAPLSPEESLPNTQLAQDSSLVADEAMKLVFRELLRRCAGKRYGVELAAAYVAARDLKALIGSWESTVNLLVESYGQLATDQLENEGVSSLDVHGRGLSYFDEPWTKTTNKDDVREFFWKDPLLRPSLQPMWQTLDGLNRKRLILGEEPVPGTEVFAKKKIRLGGE